MKYNDRIFIAADTGAGKSEFMLHLWEQFRCQRALLDTKDEFSLPDLVKLEAGERGDRRLTQKELAGLPQRVRLMAQRKGVPVDLIPIVKPTTDPDAFGYQLRRSPTVHYIPQQMGKAGIAEMDDVFRYAFTVPGARQVHAHEIGDVCQYNANRTPPWFDRYMAQGRVKAKGLVSATQLPVGIPVRTKALSQHIIVLVPAFDRPEDKKVIASLIAMSEQQTDATLRQIHEELGDYAGLHYTKDVKVQTAALRPLNEQARSLITTIRRDDA